MFIMYIYTKQSKYNYQKKKNTSCSGAIYCLSRWLRRRLHFK